MTRLQRIVLYIVALLIPLFVLVGCSKGDVSQATTQAVSASSNYSIDTKQTTAEGHVDIYMLDIGQGDAILLKVGDEYSMIDTGDIEHRENIVAQLQNMGVTKLKNSYYYTSSCGSYGWFLSDC